MSSKVVPSPDDSSPERVSPQGPAVPPAAWGPSAPTDTCLTPDEHSCTKDPDAPPRHPPPLSLAFASLSGKGDGRPSRLLFAGDIDVNKRKSVGECKTDAHGKDDSSEEEWDGSAASPAADVQLARRTSSPRRLSVFPVAALGEAPGGALILTAEQQRKQSTRASVQLQGSGESPTAGGGRRGSIHVEKVVSHLLIC